MADETKPLIINGHNIDSLETYFNGRALVPGILLNKGETIVSPHTFVQSHLATIRNNPSSPTVLPFLDRLLKYKAALETQ